LLVAEGKRAGKNCDELTVTYNEHYGSEKTEAKPELKGGFL